MTAPSQSAAKPPSPAAAARPAGRANPQPAPAARSRGERVATFLLAGLVLVFAFLAASFVARNSDLWLHLAAGRALAQGTYQFGTDPFTYTAGATYWANHPWLFDLLAYAVYVGLPSALPIDGGAALVVLKAALVAVLALFMLLVRRPDKSGWAPALCTALAVLAMSPRLLLQPACVSLLLLGLSLWLLWRPLDRPVRTFRLFGKQLDARALLPVVCVLWVNVDGWFLLGPVLAALFWLGDQLRSQFGRPAAGRPTPGWLPPVCLLACLLNPHHYHAFILPAEVTAALFPGDLARDPRFHRLILSPWDEAHFQSSLGLNAAALAYFALVVLGMASFALNRAGLRDWRILVWAAFALLGAWQARLVPFFAVVAGPVTALNLQEVPWPRPRRLVAFALGAVAFLGVTALTALALPGWLNGTQDRGRTVAWGVEPNPSLVRLAGTLRDWRQRKVLRDDEHTFATHPEAASHLAWFCPEERTFLDQRYPLFPAAADEFEAVCRGLAPALVGPAAATQEAPAGAPDPEQVLQDHDVTHLILFDPSPDPERLATAVSALNAKTRWQLVRVDGQAVIFRRRRGDKSPGGDGFDAGRLAFSDPGDDDAGPAPAAPARGPERGPREPGWGTALSRTRQPAWESAAAAVYLRLFEDITKTPATRQEIWNKHWAAIGAGAVAGAALLPDYAGTSMVRLFGLDNAVRVFDELPPDLPLLAVRAARRAVAANPDDANAYLRLGQAYLYLQGETLERSHGRVLTPLIVVRRAQAAAALRHALVLNPDLEAAHAYLADLYENAGYLDLALDHRQDQLALAGRAGPRRDESREDFDGRMKALQAAVDDLKGRVQNAQDLFVVQTSASGVSVLSKANTALEHGLGGQALDGVLKQSRVEMPDFGPVGARMQMELQNNMGRVEEVRESLAGDQMIKDKWKLEACALPYIGQDKPYRFPAYEWLDACSAAAVGDYGAADDALRDAIDLLEEQEKKDLQDLRRDLLVKLAVEFAAVGPNSIALRYMARNDWMTDQDLMTPPTFLQIEQADLYTLRGVLALEQGRPAAAREFLERACALVGEAPFPGRPLAEAYLERLQPFAAGK
jgi:tetratricopeptide (TPR) repeat protein